MNKDVIYIEPDDDITDILANIKDAKNKIIALVPPKKTGVLQSTVNFKLIAKTALQHKKTIVLITADEALLALADKVKMPTAKTLQSKPKLPNDDSAIEFGDEDDDIVEGEKADQETGVKPEETPKKVAKTTKKETTASIVKRAQEVDMELDADDVDGDDSKEKKEHSKKSGVKIPDFKKYRKFIILAVIILIAVIGFGYWGTRVAPRARITVKVKTTPSNFSQTVSFVTDQTKSDPENGIFYAEQKTTSKKVSADFEATGEVDKGEKATGTITVKAKSPVVFSDLTYKKTISIPSGTTFTHDNKKYVSTAAATINITKTNVGGEEGVSNNCSLNASSIRCNLAKDATAVIQVVSSEKGEQYNIAATNSGWTTDASPIVVTKSSDITGGSSKIVKIVSQEDVEKANNDLSGDSDKEAREELSSQFDSDYILISNSFVSESSSFTTSPALNEEVGDGVTPKIVRETKYVIYAVKRDEVDTFISKVAQEKLKGDDTQMLYSTGVAKQDGEEDKAFFEAYKNDGGNMVAKLKSTTKSGPRITEDMVKEVSLGQKVGKVQSNLRSYKGVTEATVKTSYFWVTSVPNDDNKVEIEITVE